MVKLGNIKMSDLSERKEPAVRGTRQRIRRHCSIIWAYSLVLSD